MSQMFAFAFFFFKTNISEWDIQKTVNTKNMFN
jgi:hypothetical protein